jgi:HKD family nuclease
MSVQFVAQPAAEFRIGDFLKQSLADAQWAEFRAAVAFVKRSGTKHVYGSLEEFSKRGGIVRISAGLDGGGTSAEGLTDLIRSLGDRGQVFVFKNANSSTFHPKIYLFSNATAAEVIIGSGNFTEGGLFTNYEASVLLRLSLSVADDAALLAKIVEALDIWSTPAEGLCYALDAALIGRLVQEGHIPDEQHAWADEKVAKEDANIGEQGLFAHHAVQPAPKTAKAAASATASAENAAPQPEDDEGLEVPTPPAVPAQTGKYKTFLMTLQRTDVGVGQTTKGTARRSPEIFIPLIARDTDPDFWGWPGLFVEDATWQGPRDSDGRGKMDRAGVMFRLGGAVFPVHMFYNPDKRDLRLRSEHIRSAGAIGDILYIERSDGKGGFSYYADVVPTSSPRHPELLAKCTSAVKNSMKLFGYIL